MAKSDKKVVRVKSTPASKAEEARESNWKPTPEAKSKAIGFRVIAGVLWLLAIGTEAFAIFWVLRQNPVNLILLIVLLVVIGGLAVGGSLLWKQANRLDPASSKETFRFFVQNQLGAIIALVAFLPLIILVFLNKDMDKQQKTIAGSVGIVVALAAVVLGIDFTPLSQEQAAVESQVVTQLVGEDKVWWSGGGGVMHLCEGVSDLKNVKTELASGTTAEAFAAGKTGITLRIPQELDQCGLATPENVDEIVAWVRQARGLS